MLEENQVPISARLAEELDVTPPAVNAALKRMSRDGHVKVQRGGRIGLTAKGRSLAHRLMIRHQLAEMLLTEVIGVPVHGGVAQLRKQGGVLLSELRPEDSAEVLCVYEKDEGFLEFLENLHLLPGTKLEVFDRSYDETMTLRVSGHTMHLGKPATSRIWVHRL